MLRGSYVWFRDLKSGQTRRGTYLPLYQSFSGVEPQHHYHVLADDGDRVGLLVQREAGLDAQEVLQGEGRLGLAIFVAILGVAVQLQVQTVWKEGEEKGVVD